MTEHTATVDMIVAVHDTRRNIRRAIGSILADGDPTIRALVVAHNLDATAVRAEIADLADRAGDRLRIIELADGVPSPSGPFNHGLAESDADYVGIMGSDDELDPGAIAEWRARADRFNADVVVARVVRGEQRTLVRSPPKRLFRTGVLDFAKDRLSYRSAPLGLMRRTAIDRLDLRLLDGARNGGDLPFVTWLWLTGRVVAAAGVEAYVEHADAPVRVTHVAKPVREELAPLHATLADPRAARMTRAQREALGTKLLRRNVVDSLRKRGQGRGLTDDDLVALRELIVLIDGFAPRARRMVSRAHAALFDELLGVSPDLERIADLDASALRLRSAAAVLPADLTLLFGRQSQPRFMAASALIKVGASRFFPAFRVVLAAIGLIAVVGLAVGIGAAVSD